MRTLMLIAFLILAARNLRGQFIITPKWQPGQTEILELNYSKHSSEAGKPESVDTTHAQIKVTFIKEDSYFYFLEWQFDSYYEDTSNPEKTSDKMLCQVIAGMVKQAPIKFRIEKEDNSIKILNRKELDDIEANVIKIVLANSSQGGKENDTSLFSAGNMFSFLVDMKIEDKLYGLINQYYGLYKMRKLELNKRYSLAELDKEKADYANKLLDSYDGYTMLDDSAKEAYTYKTIYKADMGKIMNSFGNLAKSFEKGMKKEKKPKDKKAMTDFLTGGAFVENRVIYKCDKVNMLVTEYVKFESTDMSGSALAVNEHERLVIRKIQ